MDVKTIPTRHSAYDLRNSTHTEDKEVKKNRKTLSCDSSPKSKSFRRKLPTKYSCKSVVSCPVVCKPPPKDIPECTHQAILIGYVEKEPVINLKHCRFVSIVRRVAKKFGLREMLATKDWNVCWTDFPVDIKMCQKMMRYQRINHFPGSRELTMKKNWGRTCNRMFNSFPKDYQFVPKTWALPMDLHKLESYLKTQQKDWFIVKPEEGSCGRGITITQDLAKLKLSEKMVCQIYIQNPYLIDGKKFDLRVYTLITSCQPLRIFVHDEGLVRLATEKYEKPNRHNVYKGYVHLTSYSVNKHSTSYMSDPINGSMRRLSTVKKWLKQEHVNVEEVQASIDDVIIKTIIMFLPKLKHYYRLGFPDQEESNSCFEIYGFDIILDENLTPYILEVNDSPGFEGINELDKQIIEELLDDTFNILHLTENDRNIVLIEEKKRAIDRLLATAQERANLKIEYQRHTCKLTQERAKWEDSHSENFRKIYPEKIRSLTSNYYEEFLTVCQKIFCEPQM